MKTSGCLVCRESNDQLQLAHSLCDDYCKNVIKHSKLKNYGRDTRANEKTDLRHFMDMDPGWFVGISSNNLVRRQRQRNDTGQNNHTSEPHFAGAMDQRFKCVETGSLTKFSNKTILLWTA
jgi:hypothetical protein